MDKKQGPCTYIKKDSLKININDNLFVHKGKQQIFNKINGNIKK